MITDERLRAAAEKSSNLYLRYMEEGYDAIRPHEFSEPFERKIRKLKKRADHPYFYKMMHKVAVIILAVLIGGSAWLAVDTEARASFFGWVKEVYEELFIYHFEDGRTSNEGKNNYYLTWIPEGYTQILEDKLDTFQRLLCHGILLNYDQVALGLVTELYRDNFIGLDLNRLRGIIENVPRLRAGFLDDKCGAGGDVRNGERACAVRHELAVGVSDEIAVGIRDKELHVRDGSVRHSVHLFHEHAAPGLIAELQRHHGIAFDFDALRGIVQNVAVFCPYLPGDDCHAGGQAVNADGARAIGHILSVGVADHAAVRIGDEELHIGNGGAGHGVLFDNKQRTHLIVAEGHGNDVLILTGEIDRFRGVGDHIPIRRGDLLADIYRDNSHG